MLSRKASSRLAAASTSSSVIGRPPSCVGRPQRHQQPHPLFTPLSTRSFAKNPVCIGNSNHFHHSSRHWDQSFTDSSSKSLDHSLRGIFSQSKSNHFSDPTDLRQNFKFRGKPKKFKKRLIAFKPPPKFQGFSLPEKPSLKQAQQELKSNIDSFSTDPSNHDKLSSYGINDSVAKLVYIYMDTSSYQLENQPSGSSAIKRLLAIWNQEAYNALINVDVSPVADSAIPTTHSLSNIVNRSYLRGLSDVLSVQSDGCLHRYSLNLFLDWIQGQIHRLCDNVDTLGLKKSDQDYLTAALSQLRALRDLADLRTPANRYPLARTLTRQIHLHIGPTNSGKTHGALVALSKARRGVFAGPLRLLAYEVYERFNQGTISPGIPPRACNLITGEERRQMNGHAGLTACTVEMAEINRPWDVAVIDEIQMIGDHERGHAWTTAVLGLPAKEMHLCGEASSVDLIRRVAEACGDNLHIHEYQRLTPLTVADESLNGDLTKIRAGDCIVAFSRSGIFKLKQEIERMSDLTCAVAYGALPPETKSQQAKLFNEGKLDVMVASDAIGMGLNLKIKRIIFDSVYKWNGSDLVPLSASQIKQIAGRAGRYGTKRDAKEPDGGIVTTRNPQDLDILRQALESPLNPIQQAAIQPSSEALFDLATLIPPKEGSESRSLSEIYDDITMLLQVDPKSYFASSFTHQHAISPLVEKASNSLLTISERETFSNAPVSLRDERVTAFLAKMAKDFALGKLIHFNKCAKDSGMLEVEHLSIQTIKEATQLRKAKQLALATNKFSSSSSIIMDDQPKDKDTQLMDKDTFNKILAQSEANAPLSSYLPRGHPFLNLNALMLLESLHRCLMLYLWLSMRFPLAFCFRAEIEERKKKAEEAIEFCLEGIRFGRSKRLRALGRLEEETGGEENQL